MVDLQAVHVGFGVYKWHSEFCSGTPVFTCHQFFHHFSVIMCVHLPWRRNSPSGPGSPHYRGFMITLRHTTLGRTPLEEWSARRRNLCFTTHNTHNRQTSMPPARFKLTIPANEPPQTHVLDSVATGIGRNNKYNTDIFFINPLFIHSVCSRTLVHVWRN